MEHLQIEDVMELMSMSISSLLFKIFAQKAINLNVPF